MRVAGGLLLVEMLLTSAAPATGHAAGRPVGVERRGPRDGQVRSCCDDRDPRLDRCRGANRRLSRSRSDTRRRVRDRRRLQPVQRSAKAMMAGSAGARTAQERAMRSTRPSPGRTRSRSPGSSGAATCSPGSARIERVKQEQLDGRAATVLTMRPRGGNAIDLAFDDSSHLLVRVQRDASAQHRSPRPTATIAASASAMVPFTIDIEDSGDVQTIHLARYAAGPRGKPSASRHRRRLTTPSSPARRRSRSHGAKLRRRPGDASTATNMISSSTPAATISSLRKSPPSSA